MNCEPSQYWVGWIVTLTMLLLLFLVVNYIYRMYLRSKFEAMGGVTGLHFLLQWLNIDMDVAEVYRTHHNLSYYEFTKLLKDDPRVTQNLRLTTQERL